MLCRLPGSHSRFAVFPWRRRSECERRFWAGLFLRRFSCCSSGEIAGIGRRFRLPWRGPTFTRRWGRAGHRRRASRRDRKRGRSASRSHEPRSSAASGGAAGAGLHAARPTFADLRANPGPQPHPPLHPRMAALRARRFRIHVRCGAFSDRNSFWREGRTSGKAPPELFGCAALCRRALCRTQRSTLRDRRRTIICLCIGRAAPASKPPERTHEGTRAGRPRRGGRDDWSISMAAASAPAARSARLPLAAIASVASDGAHHRVLCENFTWCSVRWAILGCGFSSTDAADPYP